MPEISAQVEQLDTDIIITEPQYKWLNQVHTQLFNKLATRRPDWQAIADYTLPLRYQALETADQGRTTKQGTRNDLILDPQAKDSSTILAGGLLNGITNPATNWLVFGEQATATSSPEEADELRIYLDKVAQIMLTQLNISNFYDAIYTLYRDFSIFGTGALLCLDNKPTDPTLFHFYNVPLGRF